MTEINKLLLKMLQKKRQKRKLELMVFSGVARGGVHSHLKKGKFRENKNFFGVKNYKTIKGWLCFEPKIIESPTLDLPTVDPPTVDPPTATIEPRQGGGGVHSPEKGRFGRLAAAYCLASYSHDLLYSDKR